MYSAKSLYKSNQHQLFLCNGLLVFLKVQAWPHILSVQPETVKGNWSQTSLWSYLFTSKQMLKTTFLAMWVQKQAGPVLEQQCTRTYISCTYYIVILQYSSHPYYYNECLLYMVYKLHASRIRHVLLKSLHPIWLYQLRARDHFPYLECTSNYSFRPLGCWLLEP